jgi:hypothetical protein
MSAVLEEFNTLMESVTAAWMRNPEDFVNALAQSNYTLHRIAAAGDMEETVQGGFAIQDRVLLSVEGTYARYNPNPTVTYNISQPGTTWTVPWAFAHAYMAWTEHEIKLAAGGAGKRYRAMVYKRFMLQKLTELWTDVNNSMDGEFWAQPDVLNMESSTPTTRQMLSIPALVNEHLYSLPPTMVDANGGTWDTRQQISTGSGANPNWRCYSVGGPVGTSQNPTLGYTFDATGSTNGLKEDTVTLFAPFSRAYQKLGVHSLPKGAEYSDKTSSPQVIWTSLSGLNNFEYALRVNQDTFRGVGMLTGQDPAYDGPTFRRMPVEYLQALDGQLSRGDGTHGPLIYAGGDTGNNEAVDEDGYSASNALNAGDDVDELVTGPRYYFMNTKYLKFFTHMDKYCEMGPVMNDRSQPATWSRRLDLWNNTACRLPLRLGVVAPSASTTNA